MPVVLAVAAGGSLGALARFGLDALIEHHLDALFPWSTFAINISGCFLNGLVVAVVVDALGAPAWVSRGLVIGFLGARIVCLEGLDLRAVEPGRYELSCGPIKLVGSDGAPARVVLSN